MDDQKDQLEAAIQNKNESISDGVGFLLEMEHVNSKPVQNALILNILKISDHVKNVELLVDQDSRKMLVYPTLGFWGRLRHQEKIANEIVGMLSGVLPSFSFRVVYDREIFEKSLKVAQKLLELRSKAPPRL